MIIIRVELYSAITGKVTELARMSISNDGTGTNNNRHYNVISYRGRDKASLDKMTPIKNARIENWPAPHYHIWNLVAKALKNLGYTQGQ